MAHRTSAERKAQRKRSRERTHEAAHAAGLDPLALAAERARFARERDAERALVGRPVHTCEGCGELFTSPRTLRYPTCSPECEPLAMNARDRQRSGAQVLDSLGVLA